MQVRYTHWAIIIGCGYTNKYQLLTSPTSVSLRTTKEFSERDALNKGLIGAGFGRFGQSGNDGKASYYYKTVEINPSIFI